MTSMLASKSIYAFQPVSWARGVSRKFLVRLHSFRIRWSTPERSVVWRTLPNQRVAKSRLRTSALRIKPWNLSVCLVYALTLVLSGCQGRSETPAISSGPSTGPVNTTDVTTYHNDVGRTGQNLMETTLTPTNVNSQSFGLLRILLVDGKVAAEAL